MHVIGHDAVPPAAGQTSIEPVDLDELFAWSDVISRHCPLTPAVKGLVNAARLVRMKKTAFLINTSRAALIDEADLVAALNSGSIAGAGLDVLSVEPPQPDNPLVTALNCVITPHIARATHSARQRLWQTSIDNLAAYAAGTPRNVVNHWK